MIRERRTKSGKVRYKIEVRSNGEGFYGYAHTLEEARIKEQGFKSQRRSKKKVDPMDYLRRAWV